MKKYILITLITALILTGCGNKENKVIEEAINNTTISNNKITSYRAKVKIKGKDINENYIVENKNNEEYEITINDEEEKVITIKDGKSSEETKYDYTKTDLFIEQLKEIEKTNERKETIGNEEYTIYEFKIKKDDINKILNIFNKTTEEEGTGYVYLDSKNNVYIVNYDIDGININVSYTRLK